MTIRSTQLNFVTTNQSLWTEGAAREWRISTEDLLVYESPRLERNFDFDIWVAGASGTFYLEFYVGLEAYAELVDSGHFDAGFSFNVNVDYDSAVLIDAFNPANSTVNFDFSDWSVNRAYIDSEGFSGSPGAGLDFVFGAEAGIADLEYFAFGFSGGPRDVEFFDFDARIPIIEIRPETSLTVSPYPGIEITGRLPQGADTFGQSFGSLEVTSKGRSTTKFLELDVDIDEVIIELASKIPKIGKIIEKVGAVVFAEYEYDLNDYLSIVPEGKVRLEATMLDIQANAGIYLTETLNLSIQNEAAPVNVTLRSDNATPFDFSDDQLVTTTLGSSVDILAPTQAALNVDQSDGLGLGVGTFNVTAFYDLSPLQYEHSVGLGLDASLTITALRAFFGGDWVPDELTLDFGPLLEVVFPEGGFQTDLFDFFSNDYTTTAGQFTNATAGTDPSTWGYQQGTFNQVTETYEIFATDSAPNGWNPDASGAVQQIYAFKEAIQENLAAAVNATSDIWINDLIGAGPQNVANLSAGVTQILNVTDYTRFWLADVSSDVQITQPFNNNHIVIAPADAGTLGYSSDQDLEVNFIAFDGTPSFNDPYFYASSISASASTATLLDVLDTLQTDMTAIVYEYGNHTLRSANAPNIIGRNGDDVLVRGGQNPTATAEAELFDGGGGNDIFIANYLQSDPNAIISFDWSDANPSDGVQIGDVTVRNVESFVIRTGNADDYLVGGTDENFFETSGGSDFIIIDEQSNLTTVAAGSDDDVIIANAGNNNGFYPEHDIFGGTGMDLGVLQVTNNGNTFSYSDNGLTVRDDSTVIYVEHDSSVTELLSFIDFHQSSSFGSSTTLDLYSIYSQDITQNLAKIIYFTNDLSTSFYADVEGVSVVAGNDTSDIVLYNGGLTYDGGTGEIIDWPSSGVNTTDTLFGDFSAYSSLWGLDTGVYLIAADRIGQIGDDVVLSYGQSTIEGFERFVAEGTDYEDYFLGGRHDDYFSGGDGNDIIDGGEFETFTDAERDASTQTTSYFTVSEERDVLEGGNGDDTFYWSDDGADIIYGGSVSAPGNPIATDYDTGGDNDWLNIQAESDSLGLEYGLYADSSATTRTVYDANSSISELLTAQSTIGDTTLQVGGVTVYAGTGLRFGDTLGTSIFDPHLHYQGIEHVNINTAHTSGSYESSQDDLLIYQDGATYIAGEATGGGDRDTFVADFSASDTGLNFQIIEDDQFGQFLENGVFVQGIERAVLTGGGGNDRFIGGADSDYLNGGTGADHLYGGRDGGVNSGDDILIGGDGNDVALWMFDGSDEIDGGAGDDTLVVATSDQGLRLDGYDVNGANLFFDLRAGSTRTALETAFDQMYNVVQMDVYISELSGAYSDILNFSNFEHVNWSGSDAYSDAVIFMGGQINYGGESIGDSDIFIADFSSETEDLTLIADSHLNVGEIGEFDTESGDYEGTYELMNDIGNGIFIGGFERFYVAGGEGNDTLIGGAYSDTLFGGDGNDIIDARSGGTITERDYLNGGSGDDVLTYTGGFTEIDGGADGPNFGDHDILNFEVNPATLSSGFTLVVLDDSGQQMGGVYIAGDGPGNSVNRTDFTALFNLVPARAGDAFNGPAEADALRYDHGQGSLIYRNIEEISLTGSQYADFLVAPFRNGTLFGADGDDVLVSGIGLDVLIGGDGYDTYAFDTGNGGSGIDRIVGETVDGGQLYFNDKSLLDVTFSITNDDDLVIDMSGGQITIEDYFESGGDGYNFDFNFTDYVGKLDGTGPGIGAIINLGSLPGINPQGMQPFGAEISGTQGDDNIVYETTSDDDIYRAGGGDDFINGSDGRDLIDGSTGNDTVSYFDNADGAGVTVNLTYRAGYAGIALGDTLLGIENVFGTDYADYIEGDRAVNILFGAGGHDWILGREGDDTISGGDGDDDLYGNAGDDRLLGDAGEDELIGGGGHDFLAGGEDDDILIGDNGNDTLIGGAGDDTATGGAGDDVYVHGGADDPDTIITSQTDDENGYDSFDGGVGTDMLDLGNYEFAVRVAFNDDVITQYGDSYDPNSNASVYGVIDITSVEEFALTAYDDYVIGGGFGNTYLGGDGDDYFITGISAEIYFGELGYDTIADSDAGSSGATIDLSAAAQTFTDSSGYVHTIGTFDHYIGSSNDDTFTGDEFANDFTDGDGVDTFYGYGGDDYVYAGVSSTLYNDYYDGGEGVDTVDYSAATNGIIIDLLYEETFDDSGTASIGNDTLISFENAIGGSGDDTLFGGNANNVLEAGSGDDTVYGEDGDDRIVGGLGDDTYDGGSNSDTGLDIVDYSEITQSITLDLTLAANQAQGAGIGQDTFTDIEAYVAGGGDDSFTGDAGDNIFYYAGLAGTGGNDTFDGGTDGNDIVDFSEFGAAIRVDLNASTQVSTQDLDYISEDPNNTFRDIATLTNIDSIVLTDFGDEFIGNSADNILEGQGGDDVLVGMEGNDVFIGGDGRDTIDYSRGTGTANDPDGRIIIDMTGFPSGVGIAFAIDSYGDIDSFSSIENIRGSNGSDFIAGDGSDNVLDGGDGDDVIFGISGSNILLGGEGLDTITGGIGMDIISGEAGSDMLYGGSGDDVIDGGAQTDTLNGAEGHDRLLGGTGNDDLFGELGNDILEGQGGGDDLDGGDGFDFASYESANNSVEVNLGSGLATGSHATNDTFVDIEGLIGSANGDILTGDADDNVLYGRGGKDNLGGSNGDDVLYGEGGDDTLRGGNGADYLDGGDGIDIVRYNGSSEGIVVDMISGAAFGGQAEGDTVLNFEKLFATNHDDVILGNDLNNRLYGLGGDDILSGGAGTDKLWGGSGADSFVFNLGDARVFIMDFEDDIDALDLSSYGFADIAAALSFMTQNGDDVRFNDTYGNSIFILDMDLNDLADDIIISQPLA